MVNLLKTSIVCLLLVFASEAANSKLNVLFIAVDDLRPQLKTYGDEEGYGNHQMITPNLDQLANEGVRFDRHYAQVPTCGASRYLMLTGRREHVTGNYIIREKISSLPSPESMPHLFKQNGYRTIAIGKIGHSPDGREYNYDGSGDGRMEMARSWHEAGLPYGEWGYGWGAFFGYAGGTSREGPNQNDPRKIFDDSDVPDTGFPDGLIAMDAVKKLQKLKDSTFFLAVGFFKPHLPFTAPKKYWDMYDRDKIELSPYATSFGGNDGETGGYDFLGLTGKDKDRYKRHGYYAAVSYVDAQIGKVLGALDSLGLSDNTIVVVWGDHGWHLGDLNHWAKHTTHEWSLRSALIIRAPGMATGVAQGLVETIDIYPTLTELTGLRPPASVAGQSFSHLLKNPNLPGKSAAFGYWSGGSVSMRTERYRLIKTRDSDTRLFDHTTDPGETSDITSGNSNLIDSLMKLLNADNPSYPKIPGCMDPQYQEYDSTATIEDSSCNTLSSYKKHNIPLETLNGKLKIISDGAGGLKIQPGFTEEYSIDLLTINGQRLSSHSIMGAVHITSSFPGPGLYIIKVRKGREKMAYKMFVFF